MSPTECPRCNLPWDEDAWKCDGCGHEPDQDFESIRSRLRERLRRSRIVFATTILVGLAILGGVVLLAMYGWLYLSVPLMLAVVGSTVHAARKISTVREHLALLDRRHVPLPRATAREPDR